MIGIEIFENVLFINKYTLLQVKQQACSEIKEPKLPNKNYITFGISGISKFPEAKLVTKYSDGTLLGITIRKTFVFGSKYGLGVFALFPIGERQIGWVPERNKAVFKTSYYTKEQFKNFRSLQAYNQMVSGFVNSVLGRQVSGKCMILGKVRHSQRMNEICGSVQRMSGALDHYHQ